MEAAEVLRFLQDFFVAEQQLHRDHAHMTDPDLFREEKRRVLQGFCVAGYVPWNFTADVGGQEREQAFAGFRRRRCFKVVPHAYEDGGEAWWAYSSGTTWYNHDKYHRRFLVVERDGEPRLLGDQRGCSTCKTTGRIPSGLERGREIRRAAAVTEGRRCPRCDGEGWWGTVEGGIEQVGKAVGDPVRIEEPREKDAAAHGMS